MVLKSRKWIYAFISVVLLIIIVSIVTGIKENLRKSENIVDEKESAEETVVLIHTATASLKRIHFFVLAPWGSYFVADSNKITEWDSEGRYLREIGSQGQGPGQFSMIMGVKCEQDKIYINDQGRKIIIYSKEGDFIKQFLLDNFLTSSFFPVGEDEIVGISLSNMEAGILGQVTKIDSSGRITKIFEKPRPHGQITIRTSKSGGVIGGVFSPEKTPMFFLARSRNGIWIAYNTSFNLRLYDYEGNLLREIGNNAMPAPPTPKTLIKKIFSSKIDSQLPIFNQILGDEAGRIYVFKTRAYRKRKDSVEADVFSENGEYLLSMRFPAKPVLISNGNIYYISEDQDGWPVVCKMKTRRI